MAGKPLECSDSPARFHGTDVSYVARRSRFGLAVTIRSHCPLRVRAIIISPALCYAHHPNCKSSGPCYHVAPYFSFCLLDLPPRFLSRRLRFRFHLCSAFD